MSETRYQQMTWQLAHWQDSVTHYNVTRQTQYLDTAKAERDRAKRRIEDALEAKDATIRESAEVMEAALGYISFVLANAEDMPSAVVLGATTTGQALEAAIRKARGEVAP